MHKPKIAMDEVKTDASAADLPPAQVVRRRRWLPSLIWLLPLVSALVGIGLIVKVLTERGPLITISLSKAEGLEAGKTKVKYKDVDIGTVQAISLSDDLARVLVTVQLQREAQKFTSATTRFWVVRPRMEASGISGLGTLLSGAYIGADPGDAQETAKSFTGLEVPPIVTRDSSGRQYVLHATDIGSLDIGSPVYLRRIKVGQVTAFELDPDGKGVTLRIFVNAPYQAFIGANTRFWHASGFDMQLNSNGLKLRTQSLATVVLGGIAFQSPDDNMGPAAAENTAFVLANDETVAMKEPDGPPLPVLMYFNQSLRGLAPGATVDFRGLAIGEVKSIGIEFDDKRREFHMPVLVQIYPERLRARYRQAEPRSRDQHEQSLQFMVQRGLRAQLRTANLLTGQLYVAFDFFPASPQVRIDTKKIPVEIPTIPNSLDEIQTDIATLASKLSKLPIDKIGADVQKALGSLNSTLVNAEGLIKNLNNDVAPEMTAAMKDVRKTLETVEGTLSQEAPLQQDLRQTLQELTRAASSLRILTDYLERHPESLIRGKSKDQR